MWCACSVRGSSQWCSHSPVGRTPPRPAHEVCSASGTFTQPPTTESTARTASGTHMTAGASCRCFDSSAPVRFDPWKVMTIMRVM